MTPFPTEDSQLEDAIRRAFEDLSSFSADDEGYQKAVNQLSKLYELRNAQARINLELYQFDSKFNLELEQAIAERETEPEPFYSRVDPNTVLTIAGNLLVALIVVKYEQKNVIVTKALSFMKKF